MARPESPLTTGWACCSPQGLVSRCDSDGIRRDATWVMSELITLP